MLQSIVVASLSLIWGRHAALVLTLYGTVRSMHAIVENLVQKFSRRKVPERSSRTLQSASSARARPPSVFPCKARPAARSAILSHPAIADVQATSATRSVFTPFTDAVIALTWSGVGLGEATKEAPLGSTSRHASRICFSVSPLSGSGVWAEERPFFSGGLVSEVCAGGGRAERTSWRRALQSPAGCLVRLGRKLSPVLKFRSLDLKKLTTFQGTVTKRLSRFG